MVSRVFSRALLGLLVAMTCGFAACGDDGNPGSLGPRGKSTVVASEDGGTAEQMAERAASLFHALEPELTTKCGGACHTDGTSGGQPPRWLAPPDPYASIRAYPGIVVEVPDSSKLLTKGQHAGPGLDGPNQPLGDAVREWLSAEASVLKTAVLPATLPFSVTSGTNEVDLSHVGSGLDGAKITFNAKTSGTILTLSELKLVAPAATGLHLQHPIFVLVPATGPKKPDPVDSFSNVDSLVPQAKSAAIGPGELLIVGWSDTTRLLVQFTKLEPATVALADAGPASNGTCKSLTTFTSNVVPAIAGNTCLTCHRGQNAGATNSLDLTKLGMDNVAACAQVLTKVNFGDKAQSAIILAPTGGEPHPFKVANVAGWTSAINGWLANE